MPVRSATGRCRISRGTQPTDPQAAWGSSWARAVAANTRATKVSKARDVSSRESMGIGVSSSSAKALQHLDDRPPLRRKGVGDLVHELPHEEDAASVGLEQVLGGQGIGDGARVEARAIVVDQDLQLPGPEMERDLHPL